MLGRTYGLTCDRMTAAQVVLADGSLITCDETSDSDLYCALRGAGTGNFGVVTALTFRTIPEPQATAFHLSWPQRGMPEAMNAWMDWAPNTPEAMAASLVVRAPEDPSVSPQVHLIGSVLADEAAAADALRHFERLVGASVRNLRLSMAPISEVKAQLAAFGAEIGAGSSTAVDHSASEFQRQPLPAALTAGMEDALNADRIPGQVREFAFTPMGGVYNQVPADALPSCTAVMSSCWNPPPRRIRPNRPPPHAQQPNGLARIASSQWIRHRPRVPELPRPGAVRPATRITRAELAQAA